tara:strand:+ start:278 stop:745 length:468 start_codon:yes stop_codon:yes gene_type:complete
MPIKSFRGQIANNKIETISLHTNDGSVGYRIVKFEVFPQKPGDSTAESLFQVFTIKSSADAFVDPTVTNENVDFSDNTLLAVGFVGSSTNNTQLAPIPAIIFDNMTFNQDIYIAYRDVSDNAAPCNYHMELEQVKLDLNENTVATLKDIRNIKSQ